VSKITKRSVLSLAARLSDPLGWLAPVVVRAKVAFQTTWLQGLDWDTLLDDSAARQWREFQAELHVLEEIPIPRWMNISSLESDIEIQGFADVLLNVLMSQQST